MIDIEAVRNLAKQALSVSMPLNDNDMRLWYRAERINRCVQFICRMPELSARNFTIDHFCLEAAAYFNESSLLIESDNKNDLERIAALSAEFAEDHLSDAVSETKLKKITLIIVESYDRVPRLTEAMVLSDARNLNEIGLTGIFVEFSKFVSCGKGLADLIENWHKKMDYRYWQARIEKDFLFESVRRIAEQRLSDADQLISRLEAELMVQDAHQMALD